MKYMRDDEIRIAGYNLAQHKIINLWDVQRRKRTIAVTREWRNRQRDG